MEPQVVIQFYLLYIYNDPNVSLFKTNSMMYLYYFNLLITNKQFIELSYYNMGLTKTRKIMVKIWHKVESYDVVDGNQCPTFILKWHVHGDFSNKV